MKTNCITTFLGKALVVMVIALIGFQANGQTKNGSNYDLIGHPYYQGKPLEKATGKLNIKSRFLGYGGSNAQYEVNGEQSSFRISSDAEQAFVINTGGTVPELTLYKVKSDKGKRVAIFMKVRVLNGAMDGDNTVSLNVSALGNGLYKMVPSQPLEAGEYLFATKTTTGTTVDSFSFGVDE